VARRGHRRVSVVRQPTSDERRQMKSPGRIHNEVTTTRILKAGFQAVAEYDQFGALVGYQGTLSKPNSWARVQRIALSRGGVEAEATATALILSDMFVPARELGRGGCQGPRRIALVAPFENWPSCGGCSGRRAVGEAERV